MSPRSRRALLQAGGLTLSGLLAGCADDAESSTTTGTEPSETPSQEFPPPAPTPGTPADPAPMPTDTNWRRFQANSSNTGHQTGVTAVPEEPEIYWDFYVTASPPVVIDGRLYTTEYRPERSVAARDAATGEIEWTIAIEQGGAMGMPSISGDRILIQSYGLLFAVDRRGGDIVWERPIGQGPPGCPVVVDGVTYLANRAFNEWPTEVFAFDVATGEPQWRTAFEQDESPLEESVAVDDGYVFVAAGDIVALDTSDGSEVWRTELDAPAETTPTVSDGTVYVTDTDGTLHAVRTADGSERWSAEVGEPDEGTAAAVVDDELYVGTNSGLYSLTTTGETRWQFDLTDATTPTVDTDAVYIGESGFDNRAVYAVAREDGSQNWRYNTDEKWVSDMNQAGVRGPPTLVEGGLYVVAGDGIRAFGR